MSILKEYYKKQGLKLIKELEKRNFNASYFEKTERAVDSIISIIPENAVVSWGGSETIKQAGLDKALKKGGFNLLDRDKCNKADDVEELYKKAMLSDFYIMSANAITMDGLLVNTDGRGNRLAALLYGPKNVIVIAGMNKLVVNERAARERLQQIAAPMNAARLNRNTPCSKTGSCSDCQSLDSICCNTVITRRSFIKDRIKIFIIGENLGF